MTAAHVSDFRNILFRLGPQIHSVDCGLLLEIGCGFSPSYKCKYVNELKDMKTSPIA